MTAPMIGNTSQDQPENRQFSRIKEEIEMKLADITIKMNITASKVLGNKMPANLLGGIALSAVLAAAVSFPSTTSFAADPIKPLTKETRIPNEQLADDLGEWGQFPGTASVNVPSYDQLIDDLGEFVRVTNSRMIPSHDQLVDDLGEFVRVTSNSLIPSHDQLVDDPGEYVRVTSSAIPSHDQLVDDLGEYVRVTSKSLIPTHDQLADDLGEWGM